MGSNQSPPDELVAQWKSDYEVYVEIHTNWSLEESECDDRSYVDASTESGWIGYLAALRKNWERQKGEAVGHVRGYYPGDGARRFAIEFTGASLPEGTALYLHPTPSPAVVERLEELAKELIKLSDVWESVGIEKAADELQSILKELQK